MTDDISRRIQSVLLHPIVLGMMAVSFINDQVLQRLWPSWLTGKISDFAWLFYFPLVVYFVLILLFPKRIARAKNSDLAVWSGVGIIFSLMKTLPVFNAFVTGGFTKVVGIPVVVVVDPGDMLALPSLAASLWFWRFKEIPLRSFSLQLSKGVLVLGLAALITLADAAAPDYGVACLEVRDGSVTASSGYFDYVSEDGGESWTTNPENSGCEQKPLDSVNLITEGKLQVRFEPGKPVEVSVDHGNTWRVEYNIESGSQAQEAYHQKFSSGSPVFRAGPLDAVIDPVSGNVIFAMGQEGILVRRPDQTWHWVTVGDYQYINSHELNFYALLWGEILLAVINGLLIVTVLGLKINFHRPKQISGRVWTVIAWLVLVTVLILFPPAFTPGYAEMILIAAIVLMFLILLPLSVTTLVQLKDSPDLIKKLLLYAGVGVILFMVPFLMWSVNLLPQYYFAAGFAVLSQVAVLLWGMKTLSGAPVSGEPCVGSDPL